MSRRKPKVLKKFKAGDDKYRVVVTYDDVVGDTWVDVELEKLDKDALGKPGWIEVRGEYALRSLVCDIVLGKVKL